MEKNKTKRSPLFSMLKLFALGFIVGLLLAQIDRKISFLNIINNLEMLIFQNHSKLLVITALIAILFPFTFFLLGKKKVENSIQNDEDIVDEKFVELSMILADLGIIFIIIIFALGFGKYNSSNYMISLMDSGIMLGTILISGLLQDKIVEFIKSYNPEKRGDLYTLKFQKDWMESSDEREKVEVYKAAYSSYKVTQIVLIFGVGILGILLSMDGIGIVPALSLGIVLLVSKISYGLVSIKNK